MKRIWEDPPHVISTHQFKEPAVLEEIFKLTDEMKRRCDQGRNQETDRNLAKGKTAVMLFYEPSTRTRFSFEKAMYNLGGTNVATENAREFSSAAKGESLEDMIRVCSSYGDVIVLRHPENGAAGRAVEAIKSAKHARVVPIINAGDGSNQHPTQSLLDIYTIHRELNSINGLKVGMLGDNKKSRTVRSLAYLLAHQCDNEIFFISPPTFEPEKDITDYLDDKRVCHHTTSKLENVLPELDVLYVTRAQIERYSGTEKARLEEEYKKYAVTNEVADKMKVKSIIMHPLPRGGEIAVEVDGNHRARYFQQADNGVYVRMALLATLFDPII